MGSLPLIYGKHDTFRALVVYIGILADPLSLDLMIAGRQIDPAYECNRGPIYMWLPAP